MYVQYIDNVIIFYYNFIKILRSSIVAMSTTNINIRIDKDLKKQAEVFFNDIGLNMSTAINIFIRQSLRQGKIPFEIVSDPFYNQSNLKALNHSLEQLKKGKTVSKSFDDLKAMEK